MSDAKFHGSQETDMYYSAICRYIDIRSLVIIYKRFAVETPKNYIPIYQEYPLSLAILYKTLLVPRLTDLSPPCFGHARYSNMELLIDARIAC